MDKVYERIYWVNEDVSQTTPLGATNLNKTDYAINEIDDRVISLDLTKAKESDVLTMLADVSYNPTTGVFTFTKKNGQTIQADINIEKIPVSFSMDDKGIITMETSDGSKYTADVGSLIKTYTFEDSSTIDVTETVDAQGNKTVVASVVNGSIGEEQLDPTYYARINTAVQNAEASATSASGSANSSAASATSADNSATLAESWAIGGTGARPDEDVNNAKYWCEQAESKSGIGSGNLYIMQDGEQKGVFNANASADVTVDLSGGGASDYTELDNKPQINGVTLEGNKTTDDLGIDGGAKVYTKASWESADHSDIEDGTQIVIKDDFDAMGATPITLDEWNAIEPTEANEGNQYVITDYGYGIIQGGVKKLVAELNKVDRYSTDEVKTDKEWIDGRPIYRIVVPNPTSFSISANTWAASNITVPNNIYLVGGACIEHIVTSNASTLANWLSMIAQNGKLQFLHTRNASMTISTNFLFILEYVKN